MKAEAKGGYRGRLDYGVGLKGGSGDGGRVR